MMKLKSLYCTVAMLFLGSFVYAQTADEIVSNFFENTGGIEKHRSMTSMKAMGKTSTPQGDFPITVYAKAPNKIMVEVDINGQKLIPQAFDGQVAWMLNPFMGSTSPQKLPESQTAMMAEEAAFEDALIDYKEKGHTLELEGTEEVDGMECYKLKLTKNANNDEKEKVEYHYFDTENYIRLMSKAAIAEGPMEGSEVESYFSDYQETDFGLMMPYFMETKMPGQNSKVLFEKYEINSDLSDEVFEFKG